MPLDHEGVLANFNASVNMTADEIERWLETADSKRVGWKGGDSERPESVGHASGRRIVRICARPARN